MFSCLMAYRCPAGEIDFVCGQLVIQLLGQNFTHQRCLVLNNHNGETIYTALSIGETKMLKQARLLLDGEHGDSLVLLLLPKIDIKIRYRKQ